MPLDFPTSPTNGQTYNGYVYSSSVGAWQAKPNAQSPFYTSDTPPGNPVAGDSWFNTNDGTLYVYYYDGNTYQWVEHRSQIAKSQVGIVPIFPTSVTISGGTATIAASGNVAFTAGTTAITLNGVFSSSYNNYRIMFSGTKAASAANDFLQFQLVSAGTAATTSYNQASIAFNMTDASSQNLGGTGGSGFQAARIYQSSTPFSAAHDFFSPYLATKTIINGINYGTTLGNEQQVLNSGIHSVASSYDSVKLFATGASISGEISVYGYNK